MMNGIFKVKHLVNTKSILIFISFSSILSSCDKSEPGKAPQVETGAVTDITATSAKVSGNIISLGEGETDYGHCWDSETNPTLADLATHNHISAKVGIFYSDLMDLIPRKRYYVRAWASTPGHEVFGKVITFVTQPDPVTLDDIDGNNYKTIKIGNQRWMAENLKTTKYYDGTKISQLSGSNCEDPGFCWYNNDEKSYKDIYGALYNWYAVNTSKLCPAGWRVPSTDDIRELLSNIEIGAVGGLKESGTVHWISPNSDGTNETGFTALPGGCSYCNETFYEIQLGGHWWTTSVTQNDPEVARGIALYYDYDNLSWTYNSKEYCKSVRCFKIEKN